MRLGLASSSLEILKPIASSLMLHTTQFLCAILNTAGLEQFNMLVVTKVKLSMEHLARLNGTYGGKGSGRLPVRSDGRSHRSIDRESTLEVYTYPAEFTA